MLQRLTLAAALVSVTLSACGGGGSDTAVSANPPVPSPTPSPAPAPAPSPSPAPDAPGGTPISAPAPAPGKIPAPLPAPAPAPADRQVTGAEVRQALSRAIPSIRAGEPGQYVHDGLDNALAGYIESDGTTLRTRTLASGRAGYTRSRENAITLTTSGGGLLPTVDDALYTGTPFDFNGVYPVNQTAASWAPEPGSPYFVRLIPTTLPTHPDALRLCWHISTPAATRLACTHHRPDGSLFGADIIEDITGPPLTTFSWQWEATPRPDGQPWTLADHAPGSIAGIAARDMTCITQTFGPGGGLTTAARSVSLTPSEVRVGSEVLLRHGSLRSTVETSGDLVTYTHDDANPVALIRRSYTLRAGELLKVTDRVEAGGSGYALECIP